MTTTDNSRADALTDELIVHAFDLEGFRFLRDRANVNRLIAAVRGILAASHVTQHEAAPADALTDLVESYGRALLAQRTDEAAAILDCIRRGDAVQTVPAMGSMTLAERIAHVGGRITDGGYVEFGSAMAIDALIKHVLRDVRVAAQAAPLEGTGNGADNEYQVSIDVRDLFAYLRAAWREGQHYDREDTPDQADSWSAASDYANKTIDRWTSMQPIVSRAPRTEVAGSEPIAWVWCDTICPDHCHSTDAEAIEEGWIPLVYGDPKAVQVADEKRLKIEAAIKATEYKYFGMYEFTEAQHDAVDVLVEAARTLLSAPHIAPRPPSADAAAAPADARAALLRDALFYLKGNLPDSPSDHKRKAQVIAGLVGLARAAASQPAAAAFQSRVQPWMLECFGAEIAADRIERNHRFLEEALELVQACGCTASEAHQLVDYTFGRPVGEPTQEAGGVMVTLAALCLANDLDMHAAGETELARVWTKVEQIRAKQAAKPKHSPLPEASPPAQVATREGLTDEQIKDIWYEHMGHSIASGRMESDAIGFARALLEGAKR
ncbi:hypothetical protein BLA17378_03737 [Burkholderia aenigmatica]|uniref:Uncharacterized protein n=1 Tax=Burkholderia aenigmatica TaxID=2015348 RepID=A0ABY6XTB7_9BURK|nr:hypothetical protein [Burkholderia aenigmatica]VWC78367.1 hypothetical protein BLA17378_03737 [Burkholderia aenigmatica]